MHAQEDESKEEKKEQIPSSLQMKLLENRKILIAEPIEAKTAHRVMAELLYLEAMDDKAPIQVFINSPGGEIASGLAIYDMLNHLELPIEMIGSGLVASIATIIYVASPRDQRVSYPNAKFLIHQPLAGFKGTASDLEIHAQEILRTRENVNNILSEATGQEYEKIDRDTNRDYWMTSKEAQDYGLVGRILVKKESK